MEKMSHLGDEGDIPSIPTSAVKMESRELENAPSHLSKEVSIK